MKVVDKINAAEKEGRLFWSFEYFPPKTTQVTLFKRTEKKVQKSMELQKTKKDSLTYIFTVYLFYLGCTKFI
jgi:5,10-methylenetetrahydrofolate reductase